MVYSPRGRKESDMTERPLTITPMRWKNLWARGQEMAQPNSLVSPCIYITLISSPEKAMAPHSSTLAWKIPWMEEPGNLQSMGSLRVGHD